MIYIGIDPGKSGGIAINDGINPYVHKMPYTERDILGALSDRDQSKPCVAYLEKVHSSPQMGVKSAFTFGQGFGGLRMALTALEIPFHEVRPQVWMKALGCMTKGDKNVSKRKAQDLFPGIKITHGVADALLISEFARLNHK